MFQEFLASLPAAVPNLGTHPLDHVLAHEAVPEGAVVECGVYNGGSVTKIARRFPDRTVYGFDSFEGLPESWGRPDMAFEAGAFDRGKKLPAVPANVTLAATRRSPASRPLWRRAAKKSQCCTWIATSSPPPSACSMRSDRTSRAAR